MAPVERRQHPRWRVSGLVAEVASARPSALTTSVVDLSEGGACLEWPVAEDIVVGAPIRLRFVLAAAQTIEVVGRIVRIDAGRAGIEFLGAQQSIVRQLLAEARSED